MEQELAFPFPESGACVKHRTNMDPPLHLLCYLAE